MENRELAARYAKALIRADQKGLVDADAQLLLDCFHQNQNLVSMFQEVLIPGQSKLTAIRRAFSEKLHPTLDRFLELIAMKNRMDYLPLILKEFLELRDKAHGTIHGILRMATELSPQEIKHLESVFSSKEGRPCELDPILDEHLIGGFTIRIDDTVYDSSIRTQLDTIRSKFLNLVG
jgi:F-type H+-transporting ATPase subunit delta